MATPNWFERRDVPVGSAEFDDMRAAHARARQQHERERRAELIQIELPVRAEARGASPNARGGGAAQSPRDHEADALAPGAGDEYSPLRDHEAGVRVPSLGGDEPPMRSVRSAAEDHTLLLGYCLQGQYEPVRRLCEEGG